ncbi:unnamed protein product [Moneuplotes crassus]|uniref:Homeobox domain-containing protein n=1 Tax=Euplotes crassus TaxID=5936 RepID=A0AAD2CX17_EUPCR|nr:unnamed protein product [Moneuplotes crassus]
MQNKNYVNIAKSDEEDDHTSSKKKGISKTNLTAVGRLDSRNPALGDDTNFQMQSSAFISVDKSLSAREDNTKIANHTLKRNNSFLKKTRKNLRAKKRKKTQEEINLLEAYFAKDPSWGRKTVKALKAEVPNLSVNQIYKWGYDKKLLMKKHKAQEKAKKSSTQLPKVEDVQNIKFEQVKISDYNLEVDELCKLDSTSTQDSTSENTKVTCVSRSAPPTRRGSHLGSTSGAISLPTAAADDFTVVEDDSFFYERKDQAVFYVVINGSNRGIPHRRAGRRGLFRVPSGFANMDFYTYKEEAFQKEGDTAFLGELYKED